MKSVRMCRGKIKTGQWLKKQQETQLSVWKLWIWMCWSFQEMITIPMMALDNTAEHRMQMAISIIRNMFFSNSVQTLTMKELGIKETDSWKRLSWRIHFQLIRMNKEIRERHNLMHLKIQAGRIMGMVRFRIPSQQTICKKPMRWIN